MGYDEPETLSYAISSIFPIGADGAHIEMPVIGAVHSIDTGHYGDDGGSVSPVSYFALRLGPDGCREGCGDESIAYQNKAAVALSEQKFKYLERP